MSQLEREKYRNLEEAIEAMAEQLDIFPVYGDSPQELIGPIMREIEALRGRMTYSIGIDG